MKTGETRSHLFYYIFNISVVMANVKFDRTRTEEYAKSQSADQNTIFFTSDTKQIVVGGQPYCPLVWEEDAPELIDFTVVVYNGNNHMEGDWWEESFQCEQGMTLGQFINSQYNTEGYQYGESIPDKDGSGWIWSSVHPEDAAEIEDVLSDAESMDTVILSDSVHHYYGWWWCLLGDTEVTMADGTIKQIKDICVGDSVLSLDLETGEQVARKVIFTDARMNLKTSVWDEWIFSDGTVLKTAHRHEFFNVEANRFKYLDEWQIGEHTLKQDGTTPKLIRHIVHNEEVNHYKITLEGSNNYFANGCLTGDRHCNELDIKVLKAQ